MQNTDPTRALVAGYLALAFLAATAPGRAAGQDIAPPETHVWASAGAGFGSAGVSGGVAGSVERSGWLGTVRYVKARSRTGTGGLQVETYTEDLAFLLGRTLETGTTSADLAAGVGYVRRWDDRFSPCQTSCPFGDSRRAGEEDRGSSPGLAFDFTARRTDGGRFGYGLQLLGLVAESASYVSLAVLLEVGRVR